MSQFTMEFKTVGRAWVTVNIDVGRREFYTITTTQGTYKRRQRTKYTLSYNVKEGRWAMGTEYQAASRDGIFLKVESEILCQIEEHYERTMGAKITYPPL